MKAKTKKKKAARKPSKTQGNEKVRGIRGVSGRTVCEQWLFCFKSKTIKTQKACTALMNKEFPGRVSAIFNFPNAVIGRANRGILTHGKIPKPLFKKYTVDGNGKKIAS